MPKKLFFIFLILIIILTSGFGCKTVSKKVKEKMQPITLEYWRVWDGPDDFADIIAKYKQLHPYVTINYTKLRYDEYEEKLIDAFAEDRGPDIFSIQNTWIRKYKSKIAPMPSTITMAYPVVKGTLKKETVIELRTKKSLTLKELQDKFLDVVYDDVVIKDKGEKEDKPTEKNYALPLYVDNLAMFYNRDLLNNAGIIQIPRFWNKEFYKDVKKLTKQNNKGKIVQAGVALGGSDNIVHSPDILSVLMMQSGAVMMDESRRVMFHLEQVDANGQSFYPGQMALRFYSDFANPAKEVYTWNKNMDNSLDLFAQGKLAIMFGYSYMIPQIRAQAPKLNFSVARLPQIEGNDEVNFANYWVEVVSKKILTDPEDIKKGQKYVKQKLDTAWDFLQFLTAEEQAKMYLQKTKRPTALRSLIESQIDDQDLGVFAEQLLTAKSWYHGNEPLVAEKIMKEMISQATARQMELPEILNLGARKIQQTVK